MFRQRRDFKTNRNRTNSSKKIFEEKIKTFKSHLIERYYPENLIPATLSEVRFEERKLAL